MITLAIRGGQLITPLEERFTTVWVAGATIRHLGDRLPDGVSADRTLDATGCYVTPGLVDLQVNGGKSCNLWGDPTPAELDSLRLDLAKRGVTSFLPTLITDDIEHLKKNIAFLEASGARRSGLEARAGNKGARMAGIHLEGPCLSPDKPGVHPPQFLQPLTQALMQDLVTDAVSLVTLAPELDPAGDAVKYLLERNIQVSLGHSNATYDEARTAFGQGIRLMTHTFNALPPLHHRAPGAVMAAIRDCLVSACVICDGLHVDPSMVRLLIQAKGVPQVILVTDQAHVGTSQGGLVGSSISLSEAVRNVVEWGIVRFADAIRMATWNPASAMGLTAEIGQLEAGRLADIAVWDRKTLELKQVILGGEIVL